MNAMSFNSQEEARARPATVGDSSSQPKLPFDRLLTIKEAAQETGLPYWLLLRAVNAGDIPFYRFGNMRRRVRLSDIETVIANTGAKMSR